MVLVTPLAQSGPEAPVLPVDQRYLWALVARPALAAPESPQTLGGRPDPVDPLAQMIQWLLVVLGFPRAPLGLRRPEGQDSLMALGDRLVPLGRLVLVPQVGPTPPEVPADR